MKTEMLKVETELKTHGKWKTGNNGSIAVFKKGSNI